MYAESSSQEVKVFVDDDPEVDCDESEADGEEGEQDGPALRLVVHQVDVLAAVDGEHGRHEEDHDHGEVVHQPRRQEPAELRGLFESRVIKVPFLRDSVTY